MQKRPLQWRKFLDIFFCDWIIVLFLLTLGRVVRADIMTEAGGRSKGCGTVLFESSEDAAHAISILACLKDLPKRKLYIFLYKYHKLHTDKICLNQYNGKTMTLNTWSGMYNGTLIDGREIDVRMDRLGWCQKWSVPKFSWGERPPVSLGLAEAYPFLYCCHRIPCLIVV